MSRPLPVGGQGLMRVLVVTAVPAEAEAVTAGLRGVSAPEAGAGTAAPEGTADPGTGTTAAALGIPGAPAVRTVSLPGHTLARLGLAGAGTGPVVDVMAAGVGPAAAAAGAATALTAATLSGAPYDLVVSAGIGGGFPGIAPIGTVVVADAIVAADLGAETPEGFLSVEALGFGRCVHLPPPELVRHITGLLRQHGPPGGGDADGAAGGDGAIRGTGPTGTAGPPVVVAPVLTVSTATGSAERAAAHLARHPRAAAEAMEGFAVAEAAAAHGVAVLELRAVSNPVGPRDRTAWRIGQALDSLRRTVRLLAPAVEPAPTLEESR